jgi:hypothetical protein
MGIEWFRDLIICIFGVAAIGLLIFIAVVMYLFYRRTSALLDSMKKAANTMQGFSSCMEGEVIKPIIQIVTVIQGIRQGVDAVSKLFKKKREG